MHPDYVTEQESQKRGRAARLTLPVRPPGGGGIGVRPSYDMSSQCKHTISLPPIHLPASSTLLSRCLFCSVL